MVGSGWSRGLTVVAALVLGAGGVGAEPVEGFLRPTHQVLRDNDTSRMVSMDYRLPQELEKILAEIRQGEDGEEPEARADVRLAGELFAEAAYFEQLRRSPRFHERTLYLLVYLHLDRENQDEKLFFREEQTDGGRVARLGLGQETLRKCVDAYLRKHPGRSRRQAMGEVFLRILGSKEAVAAAAAGTQPAASATAVGAAEVGMYGM